MSFAEILMCKFHFVSVAFKSSKFDGYFFVKSIYKKEREKKDDSSYSFNTVGQNDIRVRECLLNLSHH